MALGVAMGDPALIVRTTGVPDFAGAPAAGSVRMAVSWALWLASVLMSVTSKPAPEMILTASSRLRPDTSGILLSTVGPGSAGVPGGSFTVFATLGTRGSVLPALVMAGIAHARAAAYGADHSADQARDHRVHRHAGWGNAADRTNAGGESYYVVRPGDTMWEISAELGTTVNRLAAANGIANSDVISVGQRIYY